MREGRAVRRRTTAAALAAAVLLVVAPGADGAAWRAGPSYGDGSLVFLEGMVTDRAGGTTTTWVDRSSAPAPNLSLLARREAPDGTLGPLLTLAPPERATGSVDIAPTSAGAVLAWAQDAAGGDEVRFARVQGDGSVRPTLTLASNVTVAGPVRVDANTAGEVLVAWEESVGNLGDKKILTRRIAPDDTPSPAVEFTNPGIASGPDPEVAMAPDGTGRLVYWSDDGVADRLIAVRLSAAGTPDGAPAPLAAPDEGIDRVETASSDGGTAVLVQRVTGPGGAQVADLGLFRLPSTGAVAEPRIAVAAGVDADPIAPVTALAVATDGAVASAYDDRSTGAGVALVRVPAGSATAAPALRFGVGQAATLPVLATAAAGSVALGYGVQEGPGSGRPVALLVHPDGSLGPQIPRQPAVLAVDSLPVRVGADARGGMSAGWYRSWTSGGAGAYWRTAALDPLAPTPVFPAPPPGGGPAPEPDPSTEPDPLPDADPGPAPAPIPVPAAPAAPRATVPAPPGLRVVAATRRGREVRVSGRIDARASGRVQLTFVVRRGRTELSRSGSAAITRGRFAGKLRLDRLLSGTRGTAVVTAAYAGNRALAPATARRRVVSRGGRR
jgi:hypothetical protein